MYRNAYQRGMLTVLYSGGSNPLSIWESRCQDGYITRFLDQDIKSMVLEIGGTNVSTSYIICPKGKAVLGISMPFLVMTVKNLKKYFTFEVTILDETGTRRRFRVANFQSTTQILPMCTVMPIALSDGWNQIQFNLAEFTQRAYKKQFVEVQKLKVNANIRIRRIYFAERLLPEDQLPPEYKLLFPLSSKGAKGKKGAAAEKETAPAPPPQEEKKEEEKKPENAVPEVPKAASKASVHSVKKTPSVQGSKVEVVEAPESEAAPSSKRTSVVSTAATTEGGGAPEGEGGAPEGESEAPEGEGEAPAAEAEAPPAESEAPAEAPADESAPATEEAPAEPEPAPEAEAEPAPAE